MSYQIKIIPNYYSNHINAPQAALATLEAINDNIDWSDEIAEFDTEEEAQAVIGGWENSGPYYLSHGEAGRPSYEIIEDYDIGSDCKAGSYDNEINPDSIPDDIKSFLDGDNVEYGTAYDDEYDTYSAYCTDEKTGKRYGIHFTVQTVAIQLNKDDLGNICWDDAVYTCED